MVIRLKSGGDQGFTLVEVLVALFIFSLISLGTMTALTTALRGQAQLKEATETIAQIETARALMKSDMANLILRNNRDAYGNQLSTDDISVETLCGCPDTTQADPDAGTIVPEFTGYYVETKQKDFDDANNLCPSKCNGEEARVTIEIEVILETKDLFNNTVTVSEKLRTRLR